MKRYVPIIIGVVALCAVLYLGSSKMTSDAEVTSDEAMSSEVTSKSFQGSFTKIFEGENTLQYGFDLPETATATVTMDGALIKVTDSEAPVFAMYVSFEGGRGYSPREYVSNVIMPKVKGITQLGTTTIAGREWTVVASANSEWRIASVENGAWLLVVENKKADSEKTVTLLESVAVGTPKAMVMEKSEEMSEKKESKTEEEVSVSGK